MAHLTSDVLAVANALDAASFHLVGHDWGGFLAWKLAAEHPDRVRSVSVLSTAHIDAFCEAIAEDPDQKARSQYIDFFKMPGHVAESYFLSHDAERLRGVYQSKLPEAQVACNVRRLSETGALTSVLNGIVLSTSMLEWAKSKFLLYMSGETKTWHLEEQQRPGRLVM